MPKAGAESFTRRMEKLLANVGPGDHTVGTTEVSQLYARYQHEGLDLIHPRGGQAKYLSTAVFRDIPDTMQTLAASVLKPGSVNRGMARVMDKWVRGVRELAPVEFNDLRRSGHASVTVDGVTTYDKPPAVPRLTEEELKAKNRARGGRRGRGDL